jgi:hypothetical protein
VTTTTAALVRQPKAERRVEGRAVTRPSDSLGWPEGAKAIREGPEFHSCFSEKSFDITADGTKQQLQVQTPRHWQLPLSQLRFKNSSSV